MFKLLKPKWLKINGVILEFQKILLNILFLIVCALKIQTVLPEPTQTNELKAPS